MVSQTFRPEINMEDFIRQGQPVRVTPSRARKLPRPNVQTRIVDIPDIQVGYRDTREGFIPTHDEQVIDLGLAAIKGLQPDIIILGGDQIDFAELTIKHKPDSDHYSAKTLQRAIDRTTEIKGQLRADHPNADIFELTGNHEKRLADFVIKNALNLYGITRGNMPEEVPVLTYGFLTRSEELGITTIDGYPNNQWWYDDRLVAIHGLESRGRKGSAAMYKEFYPDIDVIFHHIHRIERYTTTGKTGVISTAVSNGTWSRNDGVLPSKMNSVNERGIPMPRYENWQHGFGVHDVLPDGTIHHRTAEIRNGAVLL
jgi:hypothetical protein